RGHWRSALRHRGNPGVRPICLCCVSWTQVGNRKALTMPTNEANNLAVAAETVRNNPDTNKPAPNSPRRTFSKRAITITAIVTVCAVLAVVSGLHSRVRAETQLRASAQASAIPYVDVASPKANADADEI